MSARGAIIFAALLASAIPALAQESPELRKAALEATAGQALFELGQMRANAVQLSQQIETLKAQTEALKTKCGEACKSAEPVVTPK